MQENKSLKEKRMPDIIHILRAADLNAAAAAACYLTINNRVGMCAGKCATMPAGGRIQMNTWVHLVLGGPSCSYSMRVTHVLFTV